jgi:hypothetical protein
LSLRSDARFYLRDVLREWKAVVTISVLLGGLVFLGWWITSGRVVANQLAVGTISKFSMDDTRWSPGVLFALVKTVDGATIMLTDPQTRFAGCEVGSVIRYRSIETDHGYQIYRFEPGDCRKN